MNPPLSLPVVERDSTSFIDSHRTFC